MRLSNWIPICGLLFPGGGALGKATERQGEAHTSSITILCERPRRLARCEGVPYIRGEVYQVRLVLGAPFALEFPAGAAAKESLVRQPLVGGLDDAWRFAGVEFRHLACPTAPSPETPVAVER